MENNNLNRWVQAGALALLFMFAFKVLKYTLYGLVFIISLGYFRYTEKKKHKEKYFEI